MTRIRTNRTKRDDRLSAEIRRVFDENFQLYRIRKVWRHMKREEFDIARCTVERLMKAMGLKGVIQGKGIRTTMPDDQAYRSLDLILGEASLGGNRILHRERWRLLRQRSGRIH